MASTKRDDAARKRGEVSRDLGGRLSPAIDARRLLNAQRRDTADQRKPVRSARSRYDYLTRSQD